MYGIEEIHIYISGLSNQNYIYINILNQIIQINQKTYEFQIEDIQRLLRIIRVWKTNPLNSQNLDDESIEIHILGNHLDEIIQSKCSSLKNYNEFKNWMVSHYE